MSCSASLADRINYDAERNTLFINFEGFDVKTFEDVDLVRREVERSCRAVGKPVALIANYDGTLSRPDRQRYLLLDDRLFGKALLQFGLPLYNERVHATEARRRSGRAPCSATYLRNPRGSSEVCQFAAESRCLSQPSELRRQDFSQTAKARGFASPVLILYPEVVPR